MKIDGERKEEEELPPRFRKGSNSIARSCWVSRRISPSRVPNSSLELEEEAVDSVEDYSRIDTWRRLKPSVCGL